MLKYSAENLNGSWYLVGRLNEAMYVVYGLYLVFYVGPNTSIKDITDFVIPYPTREAAESDAPRAAEAQIWAADAARLLIANEPENPNA